MTPKEKAKELVELFYNINDASEQGVGTNPYISRGYAKQCALICVDEIISQDPTKEVQDNWGSHTEDNAFYWQQVKQEINQLT